MMRHQGSSLPLFRWPSLLKAPITGGLAVVLALNAPAMALMHARQVAGPMAPMASGRMPAHHPAQHHDPLASCCDLCVASCLSAPVFRTVALPVIAAEAHRFAIGRSVPLPADARAVRLLPPAVGPPART